MDENKNLIEAIISTEWDMFISVNEGSERAECQEDFTTFSGMRTAQFETWPHGAVESYLDDLTAARKEGRNLVEAKYIHMMKTTEPSKYSILIQRITQPADDVCSLAREISDMLLEQTRELFETYPYVSGQGRPLYSTQDGNEVSVETYQHSELLTYSVKTLAALKEHILALKKDGISLAREILQNSVKFYGYESLDTAEEATRENAPGKVIQMFFGCCPDDACPL